MSFRPILILHSSVVLVRLWSCQVMITSSFWRQFFVMYTIKFMLIFSIIQRDVSVWLKNWGDYMYAWVMPELSFKTCPWFVALSVHQPNPHLIKVWHKSSGMTQGCTFSICFSVGYWHLLALCWDRKPKSKLNIVSVHMIIPTSFSVCISLSFSLLNECDVATTAAAAAAIT